jgi:hypothetical protein
LHFELMAAPTHFETQATCLDFPWGRPTQVFAYFLSIYCQILSFFLQKRRTLWHLQSINFLCHFSITYKIYKNL